MCTDCERSLPNQIVFDKIESIIRLMQDEQKGLPVKTAKSFMSKIPSVFTGVDLIQWMMRNLKLEDQQEAIHLANLIASHGYIFPIEDHTLSIKNDCTFYRFQTPCLWPSNNGEPENTDYAVYLCKRTMQGKTRLELADYEAENLARLQRMFSRKWEFIFMQAESQAKVDKKRDKLERKVLDSQERAFWDVYRPVPGCNNTTELDIKKACRLSQSVKRCAECQKISQKVGVGASVPQEVNPQVSTSEPVSSVVQKVEQSAEQTVPLASSNEPLKSIESTEAQPLVITSSEPSSCEEPPRTISTTEKPIPEAEEEPNSPLADELKPKLQRQHSEQQLDRQTQLVTGELEPSCEQPVKQRSEEKTKSRPHHHHHHHHHRHHHHHHHHHHPHQHQHHRTCPHHARQQQQLQKKEHSSEQQALHAESLKAPGSQEELSAGELVAGRGQQEWPATRPASACCSFASLDHSAGQQHQASIKGDHTSSRPSQLTRKSSLHALRSSVPTNEEARSTRKGSQTSGGHSPLKGSASVETAGRLERELERLRVQVEVKMSKVTQSYLSYFNQWAEYDPFIAQPIPSNPWISDSTELWDSERQTKDVHCRRVRRWAFSLKELLNDPAGREQFFRFLEKEFSAENLKFWDAVQELKRVHARDVGRRVEAIWTEYLAQDANCPINIDSKSYETSKRNMARNRNNRYIFDEAAGHVYQLMKNDSYPRYLRSDMYKDYKETSEKKRSGNQVNFDVFKPPLTNLKHKFNF